MKRVMAMLREVGRQLLSLVRASCPHFMITSAGWHADVTRSPLGELIASWLAALVRRSPVQHPAVAVRN